MSHQTELIKKLQEIFQIDRADLDFGIYRILNSRSQEIGNYLQNKLPAKIQAAFSASGQTQIDGWKRELTEAEKAAADLGANPSDLPKVKELKGKIAVAQKSGAAGEAAVYNHLLTFFSRYYEEGDFISQRRYKGDTYAVPYSGEEVLLHWANKDQYYTKSGENFSNYRFKLSDDREVFFRLTAADTAKDNRKDNDTARVFALAQERVIEKEDDNGDLYEEAVYPVREISDTSGGKTLEIRFEYIVAPKGEKKPQEKANENTIAELEALIGEGWQAVWEESPTEKNPNRTLLEKHLADYTAKNTADYFIHKDLGGFLRRELDFYIKNEVMDLDNIQDAPTFANIEGSLHQIQTLRAIAREIIDFLAQLEDFQKKLWLKKKFVAKSHWLITLNHIPVDMLKTVFANAKQREAWKNLFAINDLPPPDKNPDSFAESNPYLTVDTSLFSAAFQTALLAALSNDHDLDEATDGLLIHSDNFQALNLLQARYRGQVKCIYIDPPFNLGSNGDFLYKTDYKDSSWITFLKNRIDISKGLLRKDAFFYLRCDHNGNSLAKLMLNKCFGVENFEAELLVQRIRKNVTGQGKITLPLANDSLFLYANSEYSKFINPYLILKEKRQAYWRRIDDSAGFRNPPERLIFGTIFKPYKYDAHFKYSQKSIDEMTKEGRIRLICKEKACRYEHYSGNWNGCPKCGSNEATPQYLVLESDKQILDTNWLDITGYSHTTGFSTENSEVLLNRVLNVASSEKELVLDYFVGSGTTLTVATKTNRKYIGVEQGEHLKTIVIPRLEKTFRENKITQIVKVLKLESYEDTLNNLVLKDNGDLFAKLNDGAKEDYLLRYMLADQSRDSLLNTEVFRRPFNYQMDIATDSAGATEKMDIDLVETFNYLLGLRVHAVKDRIEKDGYLAVEGTLPDGETALVLWRDYEKVGYEGLDALLDRLKINPQDSEYGTVYINGDHNIATVWENENGVSGRLKIRQIESEFMALMFGEAQ